ncbi:hypothetical protein [Candidatus Reidiella endopervernicosa]|uniref:Uncharacterized protein n=1 Tax=Candidatus Reidiella endopervernicosa TaxID=2738883 RepID=A0A6N0HVP5_9GAMM|nr:hypothetical protein [Candidatus Reidiella endopervernicosa]QKQ26251.1 hypothetical protein HUE57_08115 [Candidatus Reidiella endopervernicosa]
MAEKLVISLDGASQLEYDRSHELAESQLEALAKMDLEMNKGITLAGDRYEEPNALQRAHFTALHLIRAVKESNESRAVMMLTYLAVRIPDLRQVRIVSKDEIYDYQFVFDRDFVPESTMTFTPIDLLRPKEGSDGSGGVH